MKSHVNYMSVEILIFTSPNVSETFKAAKQTIKKDKHAVEKLETVKILTGTMVLVSAVCNLVNEIMKFRPKWGPFTLGILYVHSWSRSSNCYLNYIWFLVV